MWTKTMTKVTKMMKLMKLIKWPVSNLWMASSHTILAAMPEIKNVPFLDHEKSKTRGQTAWPHKMVSTVYTSWTTISGT